jgi:hypothetical protein
MALKDAFSDSQYLFGGSRPSDRPGSQVKVAVTATSSASKTVLLANYNRRCSERREYQVWKQSVDFAHCPWRTVQYHFCRPEKSATEVKVWEA